MAQAGKVTSAITNAEQIETRGYVITEDADFALKDIALGLDALAQLCDDRPGDMPDIPSDNWGGLLRTFSRQAKAIYDDAAFANKATVRSRHLN